MDIRSQLGIQLPKTEKRELTFGQFEMRDAKGNPEFVGYASVFDSLSGRIADELGAPFKERIMRGAFKDVLAANPAVVLNADHSRDVSRILGRTTAGTVNLEEDPRGLRVRASFPDTTLARDLKVSIERGDISSMSFAFRVAPGGESWAEEEGEMVRTISRMGALGDVSIVTDPAYPEADIVSLRSNTFKPETVWSAITRNEDTAGDGISEDESSQDVSASNDTDTEQVVDPAQAQEQASEVSEPESAEVVEEQNPTAEERDLGAWRREAQVRRYQY